MFVCAATARVDVTVFVFLNRVWSGGGGAHAVEIIFLGCFKSFPTSFFKPPNREEVGVLQLNCVFDRILISSENGLFGCVGVCDTLFRLSCCWCTHWAIIGESGGARAVALDFSTSSFCVRLFCEVFV